MPLMEWTDKLSVGVPSIDAQHKKLVSMANTLYDAMKAGHGKEILDETLAGLINYTVPTSNMKRSSSPRPAIRRPLRT